MKRLPPKHEDARKKSHLITSVSLSAELHEKLDEEMRRTGYNKSELVRLILGLYFEEE